MTNESKSITFPAVFRASIVYALGIGVFAAMGCVLLWIMAHRHATTESMIVTGALTGISLGLFLIVVSTVVRVDDVGIHESCVISKRKIPWSEIGAMERYPKAYSLSTTSGKDLMLLTLLGTDKQQAIADEAIRCANLSKSGQKPRHPVMERWTRA